MEELPAAVPEAALRVIVSGVESCDGRLRELGWKVAVTPFGSDEADSVKVPEMVPIVVSFSGTFSFTPEAMMRGCWEVIVKVPDEGPVAVVEPPGEGELVTEVMSDEFEEFETMGITTKNAADMMSTTTVNPTRALMPGRRLSKQSHSRCAEFISFPNCQGGKRIRPRWTWELLLGGRRRLSSAHRKLRAGSLEV